MRLSDAQRQLLIEEAKKRGFDPDELIAAAEEELAAGDAEDPKPPRADNQGKSEGTSKAASAPADAKAKPNLFMYLLPFVTVNEVRTIWLELDPIEGGDANAAEYAARMTAGAKPPTDAGNGSAG